MKEIVNCNCAVGKYRTPWCELLQDKEYSSCSLLHFWYKIEMVRKEIEKRTSYLGKYRRTEEAKHLLDLIHMSEDEKDLFIPYAEAAMADVYDELNMYMPRHKKAYFWNEGTNTVIINDDEPQPEPIPFKTGQYVSYNGLLYMAIEDGDSEHINGKLIPTEDYRESMHICILWDCRSSNVNAIQPLDVSIFETLVARVIYKWLLLSYPDEAPRYLAEYNEGLEKIKKRANILTGPQIVNRTPRMF